MKGYKAFKKGLICRDKQYQENTVFEEDKAQICVRGMHFCENPLDTLEYYPLIDSHGDLTEFAEVEALDEPKTDDNKKFCTTKLKIGAKLDLAGLVKASVDFIMERCKKGDDAQLASSGDYAQLASSGDYAQLASSGDYAQLASSGDGAKLASSGDGAKLASSGYGAQLASSGDGAKLASSGYGAKLASSGDYAQLASSGDGAQLTVNGTNSVGAAIGIDNTIRGALGTWITLAEWQYNNDENKYICACVKSAKIDGEKLKPDTWYKLVDGDFKEVESDV